MTNRKMFQSTPSAREGDVGTVITPSVWSVSIHAFREGRRPDSIRHRLPLRQFQSTPSAREGDSQIPHKSHLVRVSIHAFREGRRRTSGNGHTGNTGFQSTPSAREGDVARKYLQLTRRRFNPRLPRGKATPRSVFFRKRCGSFNPRLPRGKATTAERSTF